MSRLFYAGKFCPVGRISCKEEFAAVGSSEYYMSVCRDIEGIACVTGEFLAVNDEFQGTFNNVIHFVIGEGPIQGTMIKSHHTGSHVGAFLGVGEFFDVNTGIISGAIVEYVQTGVSGFDEHKTGSRINNTFQAVCTGSGTHAAQS